MGRLLPLLAVFIILGNGYRLFKEPDENRYPGLVIPCSIFMFSTFLLLCDMRIYPKSLRKMGRLGQTILEYFIASYLMENLLMDFWIPVELRTLDVVGNVTFRIRRLMRENDLPCGPVCDVLTDESFHNAICSLVSLFFLISVLQATRAIDFGHLRCGVGFFFRSIIYRLRRYFKTQVLRPIGLDNKKRVHISGTLLERSSDDRINIKPISPRSDSPRKDDCELSAEEYCHYHGDIYNNDLDLRQTFSDFEMAMNDEYFE